MYTYPHIIVSKNARELEWRAMSVYANSVQYNTILYGTIYNAYYV